MDTIPIPIPMPEDVHYESCPFCGGRLGEGRMWHGMGYTISFHCWKCRRNGEQFRDDRQAAWNSFCKAVAVPLTITDK